jgi:sugar phosphate isomerase/epimerase
MLIGYWIREPLVKKDEKIFIPKSLRGELKFASENNFDCVRLTFISSAAPSFGALKTRKLVKTDIIKIKKMIRENGLVIENITCGGNHLDPDPKAREAWNRLLIDTVGLCHSLDVEVVATDVGSPGGMYIYGLPGLFGRKATSKDSRRSIVDEAIEMYKEVMTPIAEHAEEMGVKIAFENNFRAMAGNIAQSPYVWDRMFQAAPSRAIGLRIDPSHFVCLMIRPVDSIIRKYGNRIYAFDGKDCEIIPEMLQAQGIYGNLWWRYRIPGYGDLNWARIISALMDIGYNGGIIIENEDPLFPGKEGVLMGAKYLRNLIPKKKKD